MANNNEGNTSHALAQYETALETMAMLIANTSATIAREKRKAAPDVSVIEVALQKQRQYRAIERGIRFEDAAAITHVLETYAPLAKATQAGHLVNANQ